MNTTDLGLLTLAVLAWVAVAVVRTLTKLFAHDEMFSSVPPGVIPADAALAPRERLRGTTQEYAGEIGVAFSPPRGLKPGLVGTVIDSSVDSRDITATLVDLAARGHLRITAVATEGRPNPARQHFSRRPDAAEQADVPKTDWVLTRADGPSADQLDPVEAGLLAGLFQSAPEVRMSALDHSALQAIRETQVGLYREVVERGWYRRHPGQRGTAFGFLFVGVGLILAILFAIVRPTVFGILAAVAVFAAGIALSRVTRGRTPRTAEGSAVRIQALGFKKYLATAEAEQFKFEEAAGLFSRYLPYAMVFGVAQHWAKVFGELAQEARLAGVDPSALDIGWFAVDIGSDLLWWDSLDGSLDLIDFDAMAALGGGLVEGLDGFATGVGEFMGSLDFMDGLGDGCGDGLGDLGGCLDV